MLLAQVAGGLLTQNEARLLMNKAPIAGGDVLAQLPVIPPIAPIAPIAQGEVKN